MTPAALRILGTLAVLAAAPSAQTTEPVPYEPREQEITPGAAFRSSMPRSEFELALSEKLAWVAYHTPYELGDGMLTVEVLGDENDNFLARGVITRYSPAVGNPQVSVGLGVYGGLLDLPGDELVIAAPLSIGGRYRLTEDDFPLSLSGWAAWAPDITSFEGADELLDLHARLQLDIGDNAGLFVGWRQAEIEVGPIDAELEESVVIGIGLTN